MFATVLCDMIKGQSSANTRREAVEWTLFLFQQQDAGYLNTSCSSVSFYCPKLTANRTASIIINIHVNCRTSEVIIAVKQIESAFIMCLKLPLIRDIVPL